MKYKIYNLIKNNKNLFLSILTIGCIITIVVFVSVFILNKGTFAIDPTDNKLSISCPNTALSGEEIECSIILDSITINAQGIKARHNYAESMEFIGFIPESGWTDYVNDYEGFLLINFNGVTGSNLIGTVKYKIPNTATGNEKYKVELLNAEIGDGDYITVGFENVYDEVRILSDVNTLENITLSDGTLDIPFDKNQSTHFATVNSDKVTIGATKTDENSTISGDVGEVTLHYGTNTFNIVVMSETGKENAYLLNVYRPYEFSSDTYVYSKENNYIYTGTNVDSTSILSNIVLPNELNPSIENNKLIISYGEEKILEIDIVNITSNKYIIEDSIMYIESNLTYDNFVNAITLNGLSVKLFDTNGIEITSGTIHEEYILKLYYENDLLDEYTIRDEYLNIENLNIDADNNIIKDIKVNTTYDSIISNIKTTGRVRIINRNGTELKKTDIVKTSDIIEITLNGGIYRYTISVLGDINGDGIVNINDIIQLSKNVIKNNSINDYAYKYASDINSDNKVDINDIIKLAKHIVNKTEL